MDRLQSRIEGVKGGSSETPQRITWGSELATGYDKLKYGLYVQWDRIEILQTLAEVKKQAQETNEPFPISFTEHGDLVFNCHPVGKRGYLFHLSRTDVDLFFSTTKDPNTPNVMVEIGSLSCWSPGYQFVMSEIERLIKLMGGTILKNKISEVHLCVDFIGLDIERLPIKEEKNWITRANLYSHYSARSRMSGITLKQNEGKLPRGSRESVSIRETGIVLGTGDIMLRVYDKQLELERNPIKTSVFHSVWDLDSTDNTPVTRVEFQIRRNVLRQMRIDTFEQLEKQKCAVWRYCTFNWTRLSLEPVDRKNRHQDRSELHPWWEEVRAATFDSPPMPAIDRQKIQSSRSIEVLTDMMAGCGLSIGTISNRKHNDLEGVIAYAQGYLENRIRRMHREKANNGQNLFEHKMKRRWADIWPIGFIPEPV